MSPMLPETLNIYQQKTKWRHIATLEMQFLPTKVENVEAGHRRFSKDWKQVLLAPVTLWFRICFISLSEKMFLGFTFHILGEIAIQYHKIKKLL